MLVGDFMLVDSQQRAPPPAQAHAHAAAASSENPPPAAAAAAAGAGEGGMVLALKTIEPLEKLLTTLVSRKRKREASPVTIEFHDGNKGSLHFGEHATFALTVLDANVGHGSMDCVRREGSRGGGQLVSSGTVASKVMVKPGKARRPRKAETAAAKPAPGPSTRPTGKSRRAFPIKSEIMHLLALQGYSEAGFKELGAQLSRKVSIGRLEQLVQDLCTHRDELYNLGKRYFYDLEVYEFPYTDQERDTVLQRMEALKVPLPDPPAGWHAAAMSVAEARPTRSVRASTRTETSKPRPAPAAKKAAAAPSSALDVTARRSARELTARAKTAAPKPNKRRKSTPRASPSKQKPATPPKKKETPREKLVRKRAEFFAKYETYQALQSRIETTEAEFTQLGTAVKGAKSKAKKDEATVRLKKRYNEEKQAYEDSQTQFASLHKELAIMKRAIKSLEAQLAAQRSS